MRKWMYGCLLLILASASALQAEEAAPASAPAADDSAQEELTSLALVEMETTQGKIKLELDAEKAPLTVANFLRYANEGFFEGLIFHRVIENFMIQGGGFFPDMEQKEPTHPAIANESSTGLKNKRGTIAMARTGDPDSATAQFFINVVDNDFLDKGAENNRAYTAFGRVTEGMDVVDAIRVVETAPHPKYPSGRDGPVVPKNPVMIKKVKVLREAKNPKGEELLAEAEAKLESAKKAEEEKMQDVIKKMEEDSGSKVQKTDSGLMYVVLKEGEGDQSPTTANTVTIDYEGWLLDGTVFDSSYKRGQAATFPLGNLIPGWIEGVGMMKVGGKNRLLIPPELGYGANGAGGVIPPNAWLVFDVELHEIK